MLTVTPRALKRLAEAIDEVPPAGRRPTCFRVLPGRHRKLALSVGAPGAADRTLRREGTPVLVIPEEVDERCAESTLDTDRRGRLLLT